MTTVAGDRHVFISYVSEDSERVDRLCRFLDQAGVPYWRDRRNLGVGDDWKQVIRKAISDGALAFVACFSAGTAAREKSVMFEELTIAVDEIRKRPPGQRWLLPVRFDPVDLPEYDLGGGRTLESLHRADLFDGEGSGYEIGALALLRSIEAVLGRSGADPAAVVAAVRGVGDANRTEVLLARTKEMLNDPTSLIALDDMVHDEVTRVVRALDDRTRVPVEMTTDNDVDYLAKLAHVAEDLADLVMPFCASLSVAAQYADQDALDPWADGLRRLYTAGESRLAGIETLLDLRRVPVTLALHVAAAAAISRRRWATLRALTVDLRVRDPRLPMAPGTPRDLPIVELVSPWGPFRHTEFVASTLAYACESPAADSIEVSAEALVNRRKGKRYSPVSSWVRTRLAPILTDESPAHEDYQERFDLAELLLGMIDIDSASGRRAFGSTEWFGSATWRGHHLPVEHTVVGSVRDQLGRDGDRWGPLQAGLFGGSAQRAEDALQVYADELASLRRKRS